MKEVNWAQIDDAFGPASDVPTALTDLISDDPEIRANAYFRLDNYVVIQSDLYPAAYYCVPILLDAVGRQGKKYSEVYDLIFEIANGTAEPRFEIDIGEEVLPLETACKIALHAGAKTFAEDALNPANSDRRAPLDILATIGLLPEVKYEEMVKYLKEFSGLSFPPHLEAVLHGLLIEQKDPPP